MMQVHGVLDARPIVGGKTDSKVRVLVRDGDGEIVLELSSSFPAGLSVESARWIAKLIYEAADRVEAKIDAAIAAIADDETECRNETNE